jgi:hypothetical protein
LQVNVRHLAPLQFGIFFFVLPGLQTPSFLHEPAVFVQEAFAVSQVCVSVLAPQFPHGAAMSAGFGVSTHLSQAIPSALHICLPHTPQGCAAPAVQTQGAMLHLPHAPWLQAAVAFVHVTVLVCVPVSLQPQFWLSAGFVTSTQLPLHFPSLPQVSAPQVLHGRVCPVVHSHSAMLQPPQTPSVHVAVDLSHMFVLVFVPALLHPHSCVAAGCCFSAHAPHPLPSLLQICSPHIPHDCVFPAVHTAGVTHTPFISVVPLGHAHLHATILNLPPLFLQAFTAVLSAAQPAQGSLQGPQPFPSVIQLLFSHLNDPVRVPQFPHFCVGRVAGGCAPHGPPPPPPGEAAAATHTSSALPTIFPKPSHISPVHPNPGCV